MLNRFRYHHVSSRMEKLLPACFENELFTAWCKMLHILNRCLKKAFHNGDVFKEGYFGKRDNDENCSLNLNGVKGHFDSQLLVRYIEALIQHLQKVEGLVWVYFPDNSADLRRQEIRDAHFKLIGTISEQSLSLS